jgi:hypothetical protein
VETGDKGNKLDLLAQPIEEQVVVVLLIQTAEIH